MIREFEQRTLTPEDMLRLGRILETGVSEDGKRLSTNIEELAHTIQDMVNAHPDARSIHRLCWKGSAHPNEEFNGLDGVHRIKTFAPNSDQDMDGKLLDPHGQEIGYYTRVHKEDDGLQVVLVFII